MTREKTITNSNLPKLNLKTVLDEIRAADNDQVEAQLHIARILAAIKEYKLYCKQYKNFHEMVKAELDFAVSAADKYVSLHLKYKELGYGRDEMLKLMRQLGWRKVQICLRTATKKMGYRAMVKYLEEHYYSQDRQFNFNMRSDTTAAKLERALKPFGLTISKDGRRANMTEAMEAMLEDYFELLKAEKAANKKATKTVSKLAKAA